MPLETFSISEYTSRMTTLLARDHELTIDDLADFPDDGRRYELIEGSLHVSPGPIRIHQRIHSNLFGLLRAGCPPELEVLCAPFDVVLGPATMVQPDILVTEVSAPGEKRLEAPPRLVVEILSRSTRLYDLGTKRLAYREAGVGAYWVFDPAGPGGPSLTAWRWDGPDETEVVVEGDATATLAWPYPATVTPARLLQPNG